MAVNIVNVGFKGTYPSTTADRTNYISNLDENDVLYFLGTDYGTQAWSNPGSGPHLNFTNTSGFFAGVENEVLFDNEAPGSTGSSYINNTSGIFTFTLEFNTCKVQPTFCQLYTYGASAVTVVNVDLQGSNDNLIWETISNTSNYSVPPSTVGVFEFPGLFANKYYSYLRVRLSSSSSARHNELKIYGNLFRTDGGKASSISPITTIESLPKFIPELSGVQDGDLLYYSSGVITNQRNTLYETERLVMTGPLVVPNEHFPNFYILDPNSSVRTVTLPTTPIDNQFFRFKTLDPLNAITIEDGTSPIATLNSSTLVSDLYWDGVDWTVLNYG